MKKKKLTKNKSTQNLKVMNLEIRIEKYNQLFHLLNIVKDEHKRFKYLKQLIFIKPQSKSNISRILYNF